MILIEKHIYKGSHWYSWAKCEKCGKERDIRICTPTRKIGEKFCYECCNKHESPKRLKEDDYIKLAHERNIKFLGPLPDGCMKKTQWQCSCGNIFSSAYTTVRVGATNSCPPCQRARPRPRKHKHTDTLQEWINSDAGKYELKIWARKIYKKFKYECQKCGIICKNGIIPNAHHILSKYKYPPFYDRIENGVCLCYDCHSEFHSKYGRIQDSHGDILDFLGQSKYHIYEGINNYIISLIHN